jgi:hypothetical protein
MNYVKSEVLTAVVEKSSVFRWKMSDVIWIKTHRTTPRKDEMGRVCRTSEGEEEYI